VLQILADFHLKTVETEGFHFVDGIGDLLISQPQPTGGGVGFGAALAYKMRLAVGAPVLALLQYPQCLFWCEHVAQVTPIDALHDFFW
jgi:hypothetical protein